MKDGTFEDAARRLDREFKALLKGTRIRQTSGKRLDECAANYGLKRGPRRWFWPFRESDRSLRRRIVDLLRP